MNYGYARVSTDDQNTETQRAWLKEAGCEKIFVDDGLSGATMKRPALQRCLKVLQPGDVLMVWKMDRLARSLRDLLRILDKLKAREVQFRSLTEREINTDTPGGAFMFQIIGALAEFEGRIIAERTRAGVAAARKRGVAFGRPAKMTKAQKDHARDLLGRERKTMKEVAGIIGVDRSTLYRAMADEPDHDIGVIDLSAARARFDAHNPDGKQTTILLERGKNEPNYASVFVAYDALIAMMREHGIAAEGIKTGSWERLNRAVVCCIDSGYLPTEAKEIIRAWHEEGPADPEGRRMTIWRDGKKRTACTRQEVEALFARL